MYHLFILALLAGSPIGTQPTEFPFTMHPSPAGKVDAPIYPDDAGVTLAECEGKLAQRAMEYWGRLHPKYQMLGTVCRIGAVQSAA